MTKYAFAIFLSLIPYTAFADRPAKEILIQAATDGDTALIEKTLTEADPNTKDSLGNPVINLAAASGNFDAVRTLLWAGANPAAKDASGRMAIDLFDPDPFDPTQLLLRCYKFVLEEGVQNKTLKRKNLVLISDNYVDAKHPGLVKNYWKNEVELNGRPGVDDDGNGFIDDIDGWNVMANRPPRAPDFNVRTAQEEAYVTHILAERSKLTPGNQNAEVQGKVLNQLSSSYTNPLVSSMGYETFGGVNVDMNDLTYSNMLMSASHGTHVAGLVVRGSEGKALVHTSDTGGFEPSGYRFTMDSYRKIFDSSKTFDEFVSKHIALFQDACLARGKRGSAYLKSTGAGLVNMSWAMGYSGNDPVKMAYNHFRERMGFPKELPEIKDMSNDLFLQTFGKAFQEARIAQASAYALLFYENPEVLFVVAAGNSSVDNDSIAPLPAYLSKFFPNVITVASHGPTKKISGFSSFGKSSVQIAALGENLRSTAMRGNYCYMEGTSMAAPLLAGVCAGLRADYPLLSAKDIRYILMESAEKMPEMADTVECGGILNAQAAKELAASRSGKLFSNITQLFDLFPSIGNKNIEFKPGKYSTVAVAGGLRDSLVVMNRADLRKKELIITSTRIFPMKEVDDAWKKNFRITAMGQSSSGHTIAMKEGNYAQRLLPYDQNQIAGFNADGFHIKAISGFAGQFKIMMEKDPNIISQRFSMPTPFTKSREQWLKDRFREGYTLTAVGGDDDPKNPESGFIFVMSLTESPRGSQIIAQPGPWPAAWIAEKAEEGYGITAIAGSEGRHLVVMSKGAPNNIKVSTNAKATKAWLENPN